MGVEGVEDKASMLHAVATSPGARFERVAWLDTLRDERPQSDPACPERSAEPSGDCQPRPLLAIPSAIDGHVVSKP
jgi:hypothetical protein